MLAESAPPEASPLGMQTAVFSLCPHVVPSLCVCVLILFLIRTLVVLDQGPTPLTSS